MYYFNNYYAVAGYLRGCLICGFGIRHLSGFASGPSLKTCLGASFAGIRLLLEGLCGVLLGLQVVNLFQQHALVLELVTFGKHVQGMVNVLVDLLGIAHLFQQTAEDTLTAHPQNFHGQTGVRSTAALTEAYV